MEPDYDVAMALGALRRYWWIALLTPLLVLGALSIRNLTADYQSSFKASILLPGDTEIPGSAERPELMILDDLGPVVSSSSFAEMVAGAAGLPLADVEGHLSATRYSRVATITAADGNADRARQLAEAAAAVFPDAVNAYMVADGGQPATVKIIDHPAVAIRGDEDKWSVAALATAVALGIGCFLALVLDASLRQRGWSAAAPTPH